MMEQPSHHLEQCLVAVDGTGQFTDLAAAIAATREGGAIMVGKGRFALHTPSVVRGALTIVGSGAEETIVEIDAPHFAIMIEGHRGHLVIEDLTLVRTGGSGAVLVCGPGRVEATGCHFDGATGSSAHGVMVKAMGRGVIRSCAVRKNEGAGVFGTGNAQLTVRDTILEANGLGLAVEGQARAELNDVKAHKNQGDGFRASGTATLAVDSTQSKHNQGHGVAFHGESTGHIHKCHLECNGQCGIFADTARPLECHENLLSQNKGDGALATGSGRLKMSLNIATGNTRSGLTMAGQARCSASENVCSHNGWDGLHVAGRAQIKANFNRCQFNQGAGLMALDSASVSAMRNYCSHNESHGMAASGESQVALDRNECGSNKGCGMALQRRSGGNAEGNTCEQNEADGILVTEHSRVAIVSNSVRSNRGTGIRIQHEARPEVRENTVAYNHEHGIEISDASEPTVEDNHIDHNEVIGLFFRHRAAGRASGNTVRHSGQGDIIIEDSAAPELQDNHARAPIARSAQNAISLHARPQLAIPLQRQRAVQVSLPKLVLVHGFGSLVAGSICLLAIVMTLIWGTGLTNPAFVFLSPVMVVLAAMFYTHAALKVGRARAVLRDGVVVFGMITSANPDTREIQYVYLDPSGRSHNASLFLSDDARIEDLAPNTRIALLNDPDRPGEAVIPAALGVEFTEVAAPEDLRPAQLPPAPAQSSELPPPMALIDTWDLFSSLRPVSYSGVVRAMTRRRPRIGHLSGSDRSLVQQMDDAKGTEILWDKPFVVHLSAWLREEGQAELCVTIRPRGATDTAESIQFKTLVPQQAISQRVDLKQENVAWIRPEDFPLVWIRIAHCGALHGLTFAQHIDLKAMLAERP